MIRIEFTRRMDCKQGKGRNRVNPNGTFNESTEADAIAALRASRDASEEIAPGYMPMIEARLYDFDIFMAWVKNGNSNNPPKPFRVLSAEELASL